MSLKYSVFYDGEKIGIYHDLETALETVKKHPKFAKSKYTRKGRPKSGHKYLGRYAIVDNNGNMYYIY